MLRKIFLALVLTVTLSSCLAIDVMRHPAQAPVVNLSTPDEVTKDEATRDEATPLETCPSTGVPTEKVTEKPTESPTEVYTEAPTEATGIDDDYDDYTGHETSTEINNISEEENDVDVGYSDYSASDREWIARVICMEAGNCSERCQWLVGSTALNLADRYNGGDVGATVTNQNMFADAGYFYLREPSDQNWAVADRVLSGDRDYAVMAFRTDYFHDFGTPYTVEDNMYFSTY